MLNLLKKYAWLWSVVFVLIATSFIPLKAQESPDIDLETLVEEIFAVQDQDLNYADLYESLWQRYQHPLNLNEATLEDLRNLFMLSERQISNLLRYRELYGNLLTLYELQVVPAWDKATIQKVLPFVTVAPRQEGKPSWQQRWWEAEKVWLTRTEMTLEEKKGYMLPDTLSNGERSSRYAGSPYKAYSRFRISRAKDFSFGMTIENDAGEPWQWNTEQKQYGPDFLSFHAFLENEKKLKRVAVGDYTLQWGQGLLFGGGFSLGKGTETVRAVSRNNGGVRPYASVLESGFLRGVAATYGFSVGKKEAVLDITTFYSRHLQDGKVPGDTLDFDPDSFYSNLLQTGLHRTPSEISAKNQLTEQTAGANLLFKSSNRNLQAGLTVAHTQFDMPLRKADRPYNRFEFSGDQNYNVGAFAEYVWKNARFFGEVAQSKSGGVGAISGFTAPVAHWMEFAFLVRHYDKNFHSFYGNAFGENSRNINEQGVYWGVKLYPFKHTTFSAYFDKFKFPWLKYRIDAPSEGYEWVGKLTYAPTRQAALYVQYREEQKGANVKQDDELLKLNAVMQATKRSYWLGLQYEPAGYVYLKSRVQFSSYMLNNEQTTGYALAQDAGLNFQKFRMSTNIALFDADYNNRQYVYERDVLYAFSIPAYQGRGIRTYLLLQYKLNRNLSFWGRIARTRYTDRNIISSGLETIEGNQKTDLKFQFRIRF